MKKISVLLFCTTIAFSTIAQSFIPRDIPASVAFSIKNFGITVNGNFSGLMGTILFDPANLSTASFAVSIDASSINTGNNARDRHLNKEEYFNTAAYKKISLTSISIINGTTAGNYIFEGMLNIKGTSKSISFPFTAVPNEEGYLFSGSFTINRRDFNVGGNSFILSDNLIVKLKVFAKRT